MADFYRLNVAVTSRQDILTAIQSFITTAGPGPGWTVGAYIPAGELFVENTAGAGANVYPYFVAPGAPAKTILAGLTTCDGVTSGFVAGTGPDSTVLNISEDAVYGLGLHFDDNAGGYMTGARGVLHMFGDEDRFIACLRYGQQATYQTLYVGLYTPHCDPAHDTCPQIVLGNNPGVFYLMKEADFGPEMHPLPQVEEWMHAFPLGMLKHDVIGDRRFFRYPLSRFNPEDAFESNPPRKGRVARNDRAPGPELLAREQHVQVTEDMRGESLYPYGIYRATDDSNIESIVTIGASGYFIWPTALQPDANPRCMAIGPVGTLI